MLSVQNCMGPEEENDEEQSYVGCATRSAHNSPDESSTSRSSTRLVEQAKPGRLTASQVRAQDRLQQIQIKSEQTQIKSARLQLSTDSFDEKFVSEKIKLENMKLKAEGCSMVKEVCLILYCMFIYFASRNAFPERQVGES